MLVWVMVCRLSLQLHAAAKGAAHAMQTLYIRVPLYLQATHCMLDCSLPQTERSFEVWPAVMERRIYTSCAI